MRRCLVIILMLRRTPRYTRTDSLLPTATLFRSLTSSAPAALTAASTASEFITQCEPGIARQYSISLPRMLAVTALQVACREQSSSRAAAYLWRPKERTRLMPASSALAQRRWKRERSRFRTEGPLASNAWKHSALAEAEAGMEAQ